MIPILWYSPIILKRTTWQISVQSRVVQSEFRTFYHFKKKPSSNQQACCSTRSQLTRTNLLRSSRNFLTLDTLDRNRITMVLPSVHPCGSTHQRFILHTAWPLLWQGMDVPYFVSPFTRWWILLHPESSLSALYAMVGTPVWGSVHCAFLLLLVCTSIEHSETLPNCFTKWLFYARRLWEFQLLSILASTHYGRWSVLLIRTILEGVKQYV